MSLPGTFENALLRRLSPGSLERLHDLEAVELDVREPIETRGQPVDWVYFPESGLISIVAQTGGLGAIEVGMIGKEGASGLAVLFGDDLASFDSFVQGNGVAHRIPAERLRDATRQDSTLADLLQRFSHVLGIQIAMTAAANGQAKLEARLARWLLMVGDRMGPTFHVTHEFLSQMLAVRRSGVTIGLQVLEGKGLIKARRGSIEILHRDELQRHTTGTYGFAEAEYDRIMR